jgi:EmrB/QacA subfamily drug resistance transporter
MTTMKNDRIAISAASPTVTLWVVSTVQFLVPFLMSAIGVALPVIGRDLNASAVQLGLIQTVMVLGTAAILLPVGRFADIYGRKRIFIIGVIILAISTLALGLISSIRIFMIFRFVQGIGSAMILATSIAILTAVYPPERRGRAMGIIVAMVYIGLSLGPSLSGAIIALLGWRWVFFIVFGLIAMALLPTLIWLKGEWSSAAGEPFDYLGTMVFVLALCLLIFGASQATKNEMAEWIVLGGLTGLGIFAAIEWKSAFPLLDLRLLISNLPFTFSNLATFLNYASASSFSFFFSLYLQYVKGLSPQQAGMLLVVQPAVQAILAPLVGRLSDTFPPARIATIGMAFCTIGLIAAALINPETSFVYIVIVMILLGMSLGLFSTPNMTAIMNSVGPKHQGTASSMVSTMRTMGMLFSTTAIAVILSIYLGDQSVSRANIPEFIGSMHTSLFLFAALSVIGTLFSMAKGRLATNITAGRQ